ncbi:hypothetical protein [Bythopirellula polymerisocia]|uniref:Uncharacterized protein n=1 Tax=Bythopirellula polymerisocia TaxID=2528003 RepID=A0A5C6D0H0_9BACT|nr:hypothetical protein [Bythopirellula polymerisocia]TWU29241.1 hypothetical protein Pla144_00170 [Bythopirellula polymerisocia]
MAEPLVNIGEVIVHGIVFDPKNGERLRTMDLNKLLESIPRLFELLEERQIEYVLVGGIAMLVYVEGRNTQDIDLIVARKDLEKLPEVTIYDDNLEFARGTFGELPVDFLFTRNKLFSKVCEEFTKNETFVERQVPCATVEGIVLLKLFALPSLYRQGRFEKVDIYQNDILRLIREHRPATAPLMKELSQHMLPSDIEELEKILLQIEDEIAASKQRFRGTE